MIDPCLVERFRTLVAGAELALADFDLHLETPASCGGAKAESDSVYRVRYRPTGIETTYAGNDASWIDRFAADLQSGRFIQPC